jgi:cycloeucalenol cycloisomerase
MDFEIPKVAITMTAILGTMLAMIAGIVSLQTPLKAESTYATESTYLPDPKKQPSKYAYEMFALVYTPIWIFLFGIIVVFQLYEDFNAATYNTVLGVLALPLVLQPLLFPSAGFDSPDQHRPLWQRYTTKANVWIAVYSFIGNYWYTHYFYSVLNAEYTMPATRLNNVPICMFFATHFYFSSYHVFSNILLRKVVTTYQAGYMRTVLFVSVVIVFSYFTAFMETLSISSFPYYSFEDRDMAYTVGSAFYGIYFLVSFPGFYNFDQDIDDTATGKAAPVNMWDTVLSSCGHGMMILTLLDLVRLYLDVPLVVGVL